MWWPWRKPKTAPRIEANVKKLSLTIPKADYEAIKVLAARQGIDLVDWVRATLGAAAAVGSGEAPAIPTPAPQVNVIAAPASHRTPERPSHACYYVCSDLPPNMTARECQGTCGHPSQKQLMKPCYWPSESARSCQLFTPAHRS
jgi:hypothetical protein